MKYKTEYDTCIPVRGMSIQVQAAKVLAGQGLRVFSYCYLFRNATVSYIDYNAETESESETETETETLPVP